MTQDLMRGAHVTFKRDGFDRTSINNFLALVTLLGKLEDEGGHSKWVEDATREEFSGLGGLKTKIWKKEIHWRMRARNFREFDSVKNK